MGQDQYPIWVARVHDQFIAVNRVTDDGGLKRPLLAEDILAIVPKPVLVNRLTPATKLFAPLKMR